MLVREIRSFEFFSVKKEAKASASEVTEVEEGNWVMKICDIVIYLQFARDTEDFHIRKKLSVSSIAF